MQVSSHNVAQTREVCRWLGLKASLSLERFIVLYRKYSDDQPRDEQGRWVETGAGDDDDLTTGAIKRLEPSGDPEIDAITLILALKLEEIIDNDVGPGSGSTYGTRVHSAFEASVRAANIPGVSVERSWINGEEVPYGTAGSIRTDVSLRDTTTGAVKAVWDVKTGGARMTDARADQIRAELRVGRDVPIVELHYERGSTIKSVFFHGGAIQ